MTDVFLQLIRAGLWERAEGSLPEISDAEWQQMQDMATEQTLPGLFAAGIRRYDAEPPSEVSISLMQEEVRMEDRNKKMDAFVRQVFPFLEQHGLKPLLVKGQSIARYYERPDRRSSGDVDVLLTPADYEKAKELLAAKASSCGPEDRFLLHQGLFFGGFELELHGTLRSRLSRRIDRFLDELCESTIERGGVPVMDGIPSPAPDDYLIFVFVHILQHFFQEGVGLRQVCDWCRMLYACKGQFDVNLLEERLRKMGLMSEWYAFASLAVDHLGLPADAMPLYRSGLQGKASRILNYMMRTGNFGKNRDLAGMHRLPFVFKKISLFTRKITDFLVYRLMIFPLDGTRFMLHTTLVSLRHTASELSDKRGA